MPNLLCCGLHREVPVKALERKMMLGMGKKHTYTHTYTNKLNCGEWGKTIERDQIMMGNEADSVPGSHMMG